MYSLDPSLDPSLDTCRDGMYLMCSDNVAGKVGVKTQEHSKVCLALLPCCIHCTIRLNYNI